MAAEVVVLPAPSEGRFVHTIEQDDLEELMRYSREINEARKRYKKKKGWLRAALKGGARVAPGAFSAELVTRRGGGYIVEVFEYQDVAVR